MTVREVTHRRWALAGAGVLVALLVGGCAIGPSSVPVATPDPVESAAPSEGDAWPGPDNTGVPAGVELEPSDALRITADGAVVDGLDIDGCVVVDADDVTIRNTRIRCADSDSANAVQITRGSYGFLLVDSEIDGLGQTEIGVGWNNYTLLRVEIRGTADGVRLGSNTEVRSSWIHDLQRQGSLHGDAIQSTSGSDILVIGNTLDSRDTDSGDLNNAAIMLGTETGSKELSDARFERNYLNGGNYTVNIRADANVAGGVVFVDNVYGPDHRYGEVLSPGGVDFGTDTVEATGAKVDVDEAS